MKKIAVLLLLLLTSCSSHIKKDPAFYYAKKSYEEAKVLYEQKKYEESSKKLDIILKMKEEDIPYLAEALYLKAEIYVTLAKRLKNPLNYDPILEKFKNAKHATTYDSLYSLAIYNVSTIVRLFPEEDIVPKALLLQARIYDHENLKLFSDAMKVYNIIVKRYPDSAEKEIAEKRLNELIEIYREINYTPHGWIN